MKAWFALLKPEQHLQPRLESWQQRIVVVAFGEPVGGDFEFAERFVGELFFQQREVARHRFRILPADAQEKFTRQRGLAGAQLFRVLQHRAVRPPERWRAGEEVGERRFLLEKRVQHQQRTQRMPADAKDYNQSLSAAARDGRLEMTQWLLANGVTEVNSPDGFKRTPLKIALEKGHKDVAAVLRAHGGREAL